MKFSTGQILYRFEDGDGFLESPFVATFPVVLRKFKVTRPTLCGAWVVEMYLRPFWENGRNVLLWEMVGNKRFVLEGPGKRLCYPTLEQAQTSYLIRKKKHIERLQLKLDLAKAGQAAAKQFDFLTHFEAETKAS